MAEEYSAERAPLRYSDFHLCLGGYKPKSGEFQVSVAGDAVGGATVAATDVKCRWRSFWDDNYRRTGRLLGALEKRELPRKDLFKLGELLASLALPEQSIRPLFQSRLDGLKEGEGLRLRLQIDAPELAQLPWEYMLLPKAQGERVDPDFLALRPRVSIVRSDPIRRPDGVSPVSHPLPDRLPRIVGVLSRPTDEVELHLEKDKAALERAVCAANEKAGRELICVSWAENPATLERLLDALEDGADIFQFSGHGREGQLILEGEDRTSHPYGSEQLAQKLADRGVRLVVLNSCESGRRDGRMMWGGVAPALTRERIPAVVANQFNIGDGSATVLAAQLYARLLRGFTIDEALFAAREAIYQALHLENRDWGVPVLYLRDATDVLFDVAKAPPGSPWVRVASEFDRVEGSVIDVIVKEVRGGTLDISTRVKEVAPGASFTSLSIDSLGGGSASGDGPAAVGAPKAPEAKPKPEQVSRRYAVDDFAEPIAERTRDFTGREWVFARVQAWLADPGGKRVLFLQGGPGSGKTALAARLVQISQNADLGHFCPRLAETGLAYHHFCQAKNNASIDPLSFVESLSAALANRYPDFEQALRDAGGKYTQINVQQQVGQATGSAITGVRIETLQVTGWSARTAFTHLVAEPLKALPVAEGSPILILVDALDEALAPGIEDNLVALLADQVDDARDLPPQVRFLVTSRPEDRVVRRLGRPEEHPVELVHLLDDAPDCRQDVAHYVRCRLTERVPDPARRDELAAQISEAGKGNFLYARYTLDDWLARGRPDGEFAAGRLPTGLPGIYREFIRRDLARDEGDWRKMYRPLLGLLAVARHPGLTRAQLVLASDLSEPEAVDALLDCSQYLAGTDAGPFRIYHQSFRDFLIEDPDYRVYPVESETRLGARFAEEYGEAWTTCADEYALQHTAGHLTRAIAGTLQRKQREELQAKLEGVLLDYGWLQAKLNRWGVRALLADFAEAGQPVSAPVLPPESPARRLGRVLEQAAHVLTRDTRQLGPQLLGRLVGTADAAITDLLEQARRQCSRPCLLPLTASLWQPDTLLRTLAGHTDSVEAVALIEADRQCVSASSDGTLKVWNLESGAEVRTLDHGSQLMNMAVSRDGKLAVSASFDGTLKVWSLADGKLRFTLEGHSDWVMAIALTPDGKRAVSASRDGTLKVWDLDTGREQHTLVGHQNTVLDVTIAGRKVISSSCDASVRVWDLESGQALCELQGHTDDVGCVAVSADASRAVSGSNDGTVRMWDLESGRQLDTLAGHQGPVLDVALTSDGQWAVSASQDKTVKVWDLSKRNMSLSLTGHEAKVDAVMLAAEEAWIISASFDATIRIWDRASGKQLRVLTGHAGGVNAVAMTADRRRVVSASSDNTLNVWDLSYAAGIDGRTGHLDRVSALALTPDSKQIISASDDGTLKVWDLACGKEIRTLTGRHSDWINAIALTADGKVVTASDDATLKVWDLSSGKDLHTLEGHSEQVTSVAVTANGRRAVSGSFDGSLGVWDLETGKGLHSFERHEGPIYAVAATTDGKRAVSASYDQSLKVWDLAGRRALLTLSGHTDQVWDVALTPDDRRVISASRDGLIIVWDLETGAKVTTVEAHEGGVNHMAFTANGQFAVSSSYGDEVKVWELPSWKERNTLPGRTDGEFGVALADDSRWAVVGSDDQTVTVWDLESGRSLATFYADGPINASAITPDKRTIVAGSASGRVHFLRFEESA